MRASFVHEPESIMDQHIVLLASYRLYRERTNHGYTRPKRWITKILLWGTEIMLQQESLQTIPFISKVQGFCRLVPEKAIPTHTRVMVRLGFLKRAFSIPSPVKPAEKKIDFFYCYCKDHGYYQTYQQGRESWLECRICFKERLGTF